MCGIAGFALNPKRYTTEQRDILSTMLALGIAARGTDSWGIATEHGKAAVGLGSIACLESLEALGSAPVAIMHARYRTTGPISLPAAHPFIVGNHTFAHNGAVWNHHEHGTYLVDSIVLGDALAGKVPWKALDGYGALCWFRKGRPDPRIARLTDEGELWIWEGRKGTAFASTRRILETALHYAEMDGGTVYEARLGLVYRLTPNGVVRYKKPATRFRLALGKLTGRRRYLFTDADDLSRDYLADWQGTHRTRTKLTNVDAATWEKWKAGTDARQSLGTSRLPAVPECIGIDDTTGQVLDTTRIRKGR